MTRIQFDTKFIDHLNEFDEVTNYEFTALYEGDYLIHAQATFVTLPIATTFMLWISTSAFIPFVAQIFQVAVAGQTTLTATGLSHLNAGDIVYVSVQQNSGANRNLDNAQSLTFLDITRL